jgi:hypothetical protein
MLTLPLLTFMDSLEIHTAAQAEMAPVALPDAIRRLHLDVKRLGLPSRP